MRQVNRGADHAGAAHPGLDLWGGRALSTVPEHPAAELQSRVPLAKRGVPTALSPAGEPAC